MNFATDLFPKLSFRIEAGQILIEDENEILHEVDILEFMNHMAIIQQPYYNRSFEDFIDIIPSYKIINLVIEFDNLKNKTNV